ncbi:helix-turn-helix domain-containing protein [Streptomyces millisiae]|uniref:Helix-turn-helix transcriptional regulator n=1 Tax=Streptomyces millisiae TaxID=3075542 RepID=A0ABU2LPM5_9ACTN|nr:helix-turn-helix transcriptional regulator [Streptomyces sp. DSM 44918]MDT0319536.1 helix-turn-helix transcriptional regulator [Streptomyces sp. DSM 44918]
MAKTEMPTMRSRRLGNELRRLREAAGLTMGDAARELQSGQPKISKIEAGLQGIRPLDLDHLMTLYGVESEKDRQNLKRLAAKLRTRDWWTAQGPLLHNDLRDYLTLEADSSLIRTYENQVVPGLLQTEEYMSEIFRHQRTEQDAKVMRETRRKRQELLENRQVRLRAVLDVTVLHSVVGSARTMAEQLEHLLTLSKRRNVNIQVLPLRRSLPPDQYTPYSVLTMKGAPPADYVWLEHLSASTLLEQERDVQRYLRAWDDHTAAAMSPADSRTHIEALMEEYSRQA